MIAEVRKLKDRLKCVLESFENISKIISNFEGEIG